MDAQLSANELRFVKQFLKSASVQEKHAGRGLMASFVVAWCCAGLARCLADGQKIICIIFGRLPELSAAFPWTGAGRVLPAVS